MKNLIKKISLAIGIGLLFLSSLSPAFASVNKQINYQGKLTRPSDGQPVADGSYNVIFRIYDAASGGNCLWSARGDCGSPTAKSVTTSGGVFTTILGEAGDSAMDLDFTSGSYYLGVQIGVDAEMTPRRVLTSVPQAINANSVNGDGFINLSGTALGSGICQGLLCLNPASSNATDTLLGIQNGSNPLFKVEADGKVGIGTNAPNKSLHIKTATGTNAEMDIQSGSNNLWAFYQDDTTGDLRCWNDSITGEKNALTLKNDGKVGIGTTSPASKLNIVDTGGSNQLMLRGSSSMNYKTGTTYRVDSTDLWELYGSDTSGGSTFDFKLDKQGINLMTWRWNGNVGIGTVTPAAGLHLNRSSADASILIESTGGASYDQNIHFKDTASDWYIGNRWSGATNSFGIGRTNSKDDIMVDSSGNVGIGATGTLSSKVSILRTVPSSVSVANSSLYLRGSDNGYGLAMGTLSNGSTWLQGMLNDAASVPVTINPSGGNFGIGTTGPLTTTHIAGASTSPSGELGSLLVTGGGNQYRLAMGYNNGASPYYGWIQSVYNGVTTTALTLNPNGGMVGIGMTNPGQELDVNGDVQAASFIYSSDQRLKTNIQPLADNTLEKVKQIQPVTFNWKTGGDKEIGFIAQDVEKYYPELVTTNPSTGMKGMEYGNMTAVLLKAIQEQQTQIDQLKQEVETLKNK